MQIRIVGGAGTYLIKLGHDQTFFDTLSELAKTVSTGTKELLVFTKNEETKAASLVVLQHAVEAGKLEASNLRHRMFDTFITPLDKEDLRDLSQALLTVTVGLEGVAAHMTMFGFGEVTPSFTKFLETLVAAGELVEISVKELKKDVHGSKELENKVVDLRDLMIDGETNYRETVASLYSDSEREPVEIMKWKDVLERAERVLDGLSDVTTVLENVLLKYA